MSWLEAWGLTEDDIMGIDGIVIERPERRWYAAVRHITSATDTRTVIAAILPRDIATSDKAQIIDTQAAHRQAIDEIEAEANAELTERKARKLQPKLF